MKTSPSAGLVRIACATLLLLPTAVPGADVAAQEPRTPLEASSFTTHTSHDEMVEYLHALRGVSRDMTLDTYGQTLQGRDLWVATFSRPRVRTPAEAHLSGKPIVVLGANVHGFNLTLRESLLIMMRELGTRETELNDLLDEVIVLVVPSKNPDGLEAGSRFNAVGADLNRDYMTLEQPSMAAYIGNIINRWDPHIFVDGHDGGAVQYGGAYPYSLLYQGPAIAGADQSLVELADREIFPLISRRFEEQGFEAFYWARGDRERWYGGGAAPRMGRNYGGLANKLSILFELAEWNETPVAVETGILAYRTVLEYARDNGDVLVSTVREARRRTVELGENAEGRIPVEESVEPDDFSVDFRVPGPDPGDGLLSVRGAEIVKKPIGIRYRDRPWAYVLPPEAGDAVALLRRHNVEVERLTRPARLDVRAYTLVGVRYENADNGNRAAVRVTVGAERDEQIEMPWGSYIVRTGQPLGRVVTHLLEPETSDGIVYWNRDRSLLPLADLQAHQDDPSRHPAPLVSIYRLMSERSLPSTIVR